MMIDVNILYNYRRCPYAMRARMALVSAGVQCEVHDIDFRNKPAHMLEISPKGTVPVLQLKEGTVIDESLEIVYWALSQNDPQSLLQEGSKDLIAENDGTFKSALDRYKYPDRFPDEDCANARDQAEVFLQKLNDILSDQKQLLSNEISVADICIFSFIRQCANVDREWFDSLRYKPLKNWLQGHIESDLFHNIFQKRDHTPYLLL